MPPSCNELSVDVEGGTCCTACGGVEWKVVSAIARCWRSRKATVPEEVLCGARSHRGGAHPTTSGLDVAAIARCWRSRKASPEGGTLRCQITPGEPTPRLPGVCGCSCVWSALRHTGAMWVAVEGCRWKCKPPRTDSSCTRTRPSPC